MYDITSLYRAVSVEDAISALMRDPEAVVIAGGTDVLIKVREGELAGCRLVSIHGIKALEGVTLQQNGDLEIGPLTTFRGVTESELIRRFVPYLGEATDQAGGPQLRAMGTIGGNVCNGVTSADSASTLMALDAVLRVKGPGGGRDIPISKWYQGVGKVALRHDELLTAIILPRSHYEGFSGHYIKCAQRSAMDIATLGVACLVKLSDDKTRTEQVRLAFGVAGPVPMRAPTAEQGAAGLPVDDAVARIGELALADVNPRTSWRASKEYRIQLVKELSGRALRQAIMSGGGKLKC
ncbi:MAG: xanthine dehydrogenase FAD-binding subunit XdhB [Clostridia bacterium]|nr:xanthine dehydrogenase FAD-binding subunit XdhB [Clostridia bacterium]